MGAWRFTLAFVLLAGGASAQQLSVEVASPAVLLATISARCDACAWDVTGREGAMLRVTLDDRYSQHVAIARTGQAEYRILAGSVAAGRHTLRVAVDAAHTAAGLRAPSAIDVRVASITPVLESDASYRPLSLAPFVYQRANTIGKFTDTPLFMWYETEPTERGVRYRYSVVFTNEDGGTPADRLMATWGRTTDIEYIYSVEVDEAGKVLSHDYQGPKHEVRAYRGRLEGQHARLWVATDNNMVEDRGSTNVRFAPAPAPFTLTNVSREVVMDANPSMYGVSSRELAREGKIVPGAPPGRGSIPDPRSYVYLEGCGTLGEAALTFAVRIGGEWMSSDRGVAEYRIARDGCFRAAIPLPPGTAIAAVDAVRVQAFARDGHDPQARAVFTRLNTMFMLDAAYVPGPSAAHWQGHAELTAGGPPFDIPIK